MATSGLVSSFSPPSAATYAAPTLPAPVTAPAGTALPALRPLSCTSSVTILSSAWRSSSLACASLDSISFDVVSPSRRFCCAPSCR